MPGMIPYNDIPSPDDMIDMFRGKTASSIDIMDKLRAISEMRSMFYDDDMEPPDTYGSDCPFLDFFVNEEMSYEFPQIAHDFFLHEYENIKEYEDVEFLEYDNGRDWPNLIFTRYVLNLMMNAANSGSEYTRSLFVYLHKAFYKTEYRALKRFNEISAEELISLSSGSKVGLNFMEIARILTISKMYGIKLKPDCFYLYEILNEYYDRVEDGKPFFADEHFGDRVIECHDEIEAMFDKEEMYDLDDKAARYLGKVLEWLDYEVDYVDLCDDNDSGLTERLSRSLAMLRKLWPEKRFSKEEIILYGTILHTAGALTSNTDRMAELLDEVVYGEQVMDYYHGNREPVFRPEEVMKTAGIQRREPAKKEKTGKQPPEQESTAQHNDEKLRSEIEMLKRKVHKLENDNILLKSKIADRKKQADEERNLAEELDIANRELVALRNHVHNLTEDAPEAGKTPVDEMKEELKKRKIIIIGGHANWISKLKNLFPEWGFISPDVSGAIESSVVHYADYVYFFTDTISHSTYERYLKELRNRKISFGYIHGVNTDANIRQIYRDVVKA